MYGFVSLTDSLSHLFYREITFRTNKYGNRCVCRQMIQFVKKISTFDFFIAMGNKLVTRSFCSDTTVSLPAM